MPNFSLIRSPDDWARDWGWISRRRAVNLAKKIEAVAEAIGDGHDGDPFAETWTRELRSIAKTLAPATVPAERKIARLHEQGIR